VTDRRRAEERLHRARQVVESSRDELRAYGQEQAALRRVATLVARGGSSTQILDAVAADLVQLFSADLALLVRYERDGAGTILASSGEIAAEVPTGMRVALEGQSIAAAVLRTGRPARLERYTDLQGPWAQHLRELGVRSGVGAPITVEGRLWGGMATAWTQQKPLTDDDERRLASFAELVGTAIANAASREVLRVRSEEQAALRRVATLVARGDEPTEILDAVAEEVGLLLDADTTRVLRYDGANAAIVLAGHGEHGRNPPHGTRVPLDGESVTATVLRTGSAARKEGFEGLTGTIAGMAREQAVRSTVGAPIIVEGRLWGVTSASWSRHEPPAADVEDRMAAFTDLVATAVANADTRAQLKASRARVVATADATRRRIERDLHDGAQQRLVSLALEVRAARAAVPPEFGDLRAELCRIAERLTNALDELREIAHGIHPALLVEEGLAPALRTLARRSAVPVELALPAEVRLSEPVEVAAYYVVSEALTNAAKHAHASVVNIDVEAHRGVLTVSVRDDGAGGADPTAGSGLLGLKDRAEAIGGRISLRSPRGRGTSLELELPLAERDEEDRVSAQSAQTAGARGAPL
jgi:signal transduction histidine kinase/uncharacterized protein YoaH (UPF0181 family)